MPTQARDGMPFAPVRASAFRSVFILFFLAAWLVTATAAHANQITLAWDGNAEPQLGGYRLYYGQRSGDYSQRIDVGNTTRYTVTDLVPGQTYYFSVAAYDGTGTVESPLADELALSLPPLVAPPEASFTSSVQQGQAPLLVSFKDTSSGAIEQRAWDFGNGTSSTAANALLSFNKPGSYTVQLTVSGPGGTDTETRTDFITVLDPAPAVDDDDSANNRFDPAEPSLEAAEIILTERWQRVDFERAFVDPIIVAGPAQEQSAGALPGVVRLRRVGPKGFEIRLQPWDYLGDAAVTSPVAYLALERGRHRLADGTEIEAGTLTDGSTQVFAKTLFSQPFITTPVVLASIASSTETDAVTLRLRRVNEYGFEFRLQEQESNVKQHAPERIDFIAWEPSVGVIDGWHYEVVDGVRGISHRPTGLPFSASYFAPPLLLGNFQTANGGDPITLGWRNKSARGFDLRAVEEQSRDQEIYHVRETAGFLLLAPLE